MAFPLFGKDFGARAPDEIALMAASEPEPDDSTSSAPE
jgi:hypothetical protein